MSDLLTTIRLPGARDSGLADWGRKTVPEMIAQYRAYHQARLETEMLALDALDEDYRVTIVRGSVINKHVETLQEGRKADEPLRAVRGVAPDVAELVVAARIVAFEDQSQAALDRLDKASEAFADRVPWDDEPAEAAA
jgi:hypothetical protein